MQKCSLLSTYIFLRFSQDKLYCCGHYYVLATVTLFPEAKMSEGMAGGKRKESKSIVCGGNFLGYRETFHMWLSNPMNCKERGLKAHAYSSNLGLHLMREKGGKVRNDNEIHTLKILKTYLKLVDIRVRSYFHFCWKNYP